MFTPDIQTIKKIKWDGEERVEIQCKGGMVWCGMKRKDFWHSDSDWESRIKAGSKIRLWTVQWSTVLGFELWEDDKWVSVWCLANNFDYKAERERKDKAYGDFIGDEGKKIAELIDKRKTLSEIDDLISDEHTGNTYGCALNIGIGLAKDREQAEKVRREHNAKYGIKEDRKGVVNPAVLVFKEKGGEG